MSRYRPLTQVELEEEAARLSDMEYCASDFDGDEDAEDELQYDSASSPRTPSLSPVRDIQPCTSSGTDLNKRVLKKSFVADNGGSSHELDDDADADPVYVLDNKTRPANKIARWFSQGDESSSEEEREDEVEGEREDEVEEEREDEVVSPSFRRSVSDILQPHHDDHFLLRWLRARSWNPEAAEKMLRQSMKWRQQWEVDGALKQWVPPEVLVLYHPSGTCGYDKDGAPVIIIPFVGLDIVGILHSSCRQDMIRMAIQILEKNLEMAAKTGEHQLVIIFDMEGFNLRQYAWRPAAEVIISLIQMYEANYPEILKACYIINAPRVFSIAFNVVKRFLNDYTLSKIQIFKSDPKKWKPALLNNITPNNLPSHYGGTLTDPDGNPRYATVIKQGGKVPKSMYTKNLEVQDSGPKNEYKTAVIKKGSKLTLDFIVAEEGCFLRWDFRTEDHDIRFGVTLRDENGDESPVIRHRRVAAHQIDESGVVACQAPATYTVTFDNSYSVLRSKKLHYHVYVTLPLEKLNILPIDDEVKNLSYPDKCWT